MVDCLLEEPGKKIEYKLVRRMPSDVAHFPMPE